MKHSSQLAVTICAAALSVAAQNPNGASPPGNPGSPEAKRTPASEQKRTDDQKNARSKPVLLAPGDDGRDLKNTTSTTPAGGRGIACSTDDAVLATLGPNKVGYGTALAKPRLFWYLSVVPATDCVAAFWLMCDPADPGNQTSCPQSQFVTIDLPSIKSAGMRELDLSTLPKSSELREGILYRWFISIGRRSDTLSKYDVDGAFIERMTPAVGDSKLWYDRLASAYERYEQGDSQALDAILPDIGFRVSSER